MKFARCVCKFIRYTKMRFWLITRHFSMRTKCNLFLFSIVMFIIFIKTRTTSENDIPVIFWWTKNIPASKTEIKNCENFKCLITADIDNLNKYDKRIKAFNFYGSNLNVTDLPLPRRPQSMVWGLLHEESPRNNELFLSEHFLNLFNYSSTFSRYSNVPITLQHLENIDHITELKFVVHTRDKNELLLNIAPILYIQSDCETATERDAYVEELMKYIKVDSYGACLNNKKLPRDFKMDYLNNLNSEKFLYFVARYKFTISIENGVCEDYITEKLWRPIRVGSVPIYYGSPSIEDFLPNNKSALLIKNFATPSVLADHINYLLLNNTAYEEYLEHKIFQRISNKNLYKAVSERRKSDFIETINNFECFVCKSIHNDISNIVNKAHYNCPEPVLPLGHKPNENNFWYILWKEAEKRGKILFQAILDNDINIIKARAKN